MNSIWKVFYKGQKAASYFIPGYLDKYPTGSVKKERKNEFGTGWVTILNCPPPENWITKSLILTVRCHRKFSVHPVQMLSIPAQAGPVPCDSEVNRHRIGNLKMNKGHRRLELSAG